MASKKEKIFFNDILHLRMQKNIKVMIVKESFKRFFKLVNHYIKVKLNGVLNN